MEKKPKASSSVRIVKFKGLPYYVVGGSENYLLITSTLDPNKKPSATYQTGVFSVSINHEKLEQ